MDIKKVIVRNPSWRIPTVTFGYIEGQIIGDFTMEETLELSHLIQRNLNEGDEICEHKATRESTEGYRQVKECLDCGAVCVWDKEAKMWGLWGRRTTKGEK